MSQLGPRSIKRIADAVRRVEGTPTDGTGRGLGGARFAPLTCKIARYLGSGDFRLYHLIEGSLIAGDDVVEGYLFGGEPEVDAWVIIASIDYHWVVIWEECPEEEE